MDALVRLLRVIFGELRWSPPPWSRRVAAPVARVQRAHPDVFAGSLALAALCIAAAYTGWLWWESRPRPAYLTLSIQEPSPTPLPTPEVPEPRPFPLVVRFSGPAAPLGAAGKEVATGLAVAPALAGAWRWTSDAELVFTPAEDWAVGQAYRVRFEREFFTAQALLERYELEFRSPRFSGAGVERAFYEDPTDPHNKRVTATFRFSHPVDRASLEQRLALRLRIDPARDFADPSVQPYEFKVSYDETGAIAYVQSAVVPLPERPGALQVELAPGVRAARGGPGTEVALSEVVPVPSVESYFRVERVHASVVTDDAHRMQRVATLEFTAPVRVADLAASVAVYELPEDRPAIGDRPAEPDYRFEDPSEVVPEVLAQARRLEPAWLPSEPEFARLQAFRFEAAPGRALYVRVARGVKSFGDYALARPFAGLAAVEELPRTLEILHSGSLLALSGEKKLSVLARNLPALEIELSRVLPGAVAHLATQSSGRFQEPSFRHDFDTDDLAEVFREVHTLPPAAPGEPQYDVVDFGAFLGRGAPPRGLFSLRVRGWDAAKSEPIEWPSDRRLVLVTDLGFLVKDAEDGSHDVFVVSLAAGRPVAGAEVALLGRNGLPVFTRITDAEGRATLPPTDQLAREKTPAAYVVQKDGDLAFLPFARLDRRLNLSRFDVGGLEPDAQLESLQAFLFSDRGIYRPGEEVRLGLVLKALDWRPLPEGLPLELVIVDPRGVEIRREPIAFPAAGFRDFRFAPLVGTPTGTYHVQLWIARDEQRRGLLGATSVRVEEFQPDRLAIDARLSAGPSAGWISPQDLRARVRLRNLFGTPAVGNTVKASLRLSPSYPAFPGWEGWQFFDPLAAQQGVDETLADARTNEAGEAEFALGLERFARATYRLRLVAEGFELDGGRSVASDTGAVVSPLPWLLCWKADGALDFVRKGAARAVELRAVGPELRALAAEGVSAELLQVKYVSVLQRQPNGLLSYQSVRKEESRGTQPLALPEGGATLTLPSDAVGEFVYVLRDSDGVERNRVAWSVAGEGNLAGRLERDAELRVALARPEYAPGEELEVEIQAPYTGAGLITIERDRVYAARWFTADTTGSVQRIRLPEALEGNGYVVVSLVRSLDSREIFRASLSSGAAPFQVSRAHRRRALALDVPELVLPGAALRIGYTLDAPAKLAILAVDEGVLQVARWRTPDPLGHFFRKRALGVTTAQILDLLLPEPEAQRAASAPGGDEDALLAAKLNPFKRKGLPPVAYWSGVIDAPAGASHVEYTPPDHFQGSLRIVAVAVDEGAVGVAEAKSLVRGPFVLQPTLPLFAAPGDEFEATTLVANTLAGSGAGVPVEVTLEAPDGFVVVGGAVQRLSIDEGRDANARFRVRVDAPPGAAALAFRASSGAHSVRSSLELSVRPAAPYRATLATARAAGGGELELEVGRSLHAEHGRVELVAATAPLALAAGLADWLSDYPHGCTEQLVSMALPGVVLGARADLGLDAERAQRSFARALATLQARQDAAGAFAVWEAGGEADEFLSAYATHFLLESRARGQAVPPALLARALEQLEALAASPAYSLGELRARAYALYLVTRNGSVRTERARELARELARVDATNGPRDSAALLLAAVFAQLRLDAEAARLAERVSLEADVPRDPSVYHDALVHRALALYLLAKHFPERARALPAPALDAVVGELVAGRFQTLSSALAVLALDAHAELTPPAAAAGLALEEAPPGGGAPRALRGAGTWLLRAPVSLDASRVRATSPRGTPLYLQLATAGFDRTPPADPLARGVEVLRELRNAAGEPVSALRRGEKLEVAVRVRSLDAQPKWIALVDLLPAGFELDLAPEGLGARRSLEDTADAWQPGFIDAREDRLVFYGWAAAREQRFVYRLEPTNLGRYTVPPLQAEGLYDRAVEARSPGGTIEVTE